MRWFCFLVILWMWGGVLSAQEGGGADTGPPVAVEVTEEEDSPLQAMATLQASIRQLKGQIEQKREEVAASKTDLGAQEIVAKIEELKARLAPLERNFQNLATGIDQESFEGSMEPIFDWEQQLQELLRPLVVEVRAATEGTRAKQELKSSVSQLQERRALLESAVRNIERHLARVEDEKLREALQAERAHWGELLEETRGALEADQIKLAEVENHRKPLWTTISDGIGYFFRTRGFNLLAAVALFLGFVYLSGRFGKFLMRHSPFQDRELAGLPSRIFHLSYHLLSYFVAIILVLTMLYLANDWVLLTLFVIFLLGIAWGLKHTLPSLLEQARILLNLGSIREGERTIFRDLPWKVQRLQIYTTLINPALDGARIRLPLRELTNMISRPIDKGEIWFPSKKDEWVILADGTYGKVVEQNPEFVQIVMLGGARKTYPTLDFLAQNPENLSHNFRITVTFGIDYAHQADITEGIPELLKLEIEKKLRAHATGEHLKSLQVEFATAGASSLDFAILADYAGGAAARYKVLERYISACAVDCCNEHGWGIPFTQITLHQAGAALDQ